jgi:L-gulonate 3-dehydrogenase
MSVAPGSARTPGFNAGPIVAVVGAGVVGRSWARAFAGAGFPVRLFDPSAEAARAAVATIAAELSEDVGLGLLPAGAASEVVGRITVCGRLADAVAGVDYVQESGPEDLAVKQSILGELVAATAGDVILASSTSTLDPNLIAAGSPGAVRFLVVHPVNPPHLIPVVEILAGKATDPAIVVRACEFLRQVGQQPVVLHRFVTGFLLNRLQAALLREAIALVVDGVADAAAVDTVVRDGLGLRWAVLGPFGVAATNADGGVGDYLTRFRGPLMALMSSLSPTPELSATAIARLETSTAEMIGGMPLDRLRRSRDVFVHRVRALKRELAPMEGG